MTVTQLTAPARRLAQPLRRVAAPRIATPTASLVVTPTLALLAGGLVMILSSSWISALRQGQGSFHFFFRQLIFAAIGGVAMIITMRMDYRRWRTLGYAMYAAAFAGLVVVEFIGVTAGGSTRWIDLGVVQIQPSEFAKLAVVMVGAAILARRPPSGVRELAMPYGLLVAPILGLVLLQPDLGTTVILGIIVLAVMHVSGAPMRIMAALGGAAVAFSVIAGILEPYRRARMLSFLNPFDTASTWGYQAVQARIALGEGGLFGVGLGQGRQKWAYVPNAHTDFIFAIIGEEVGLLGTLLVVATFGVLVYAGVRASRRAPDAFGRILAAGIVTWIAGQAVINMGAVVGLLPITGVPLPLVSFGGSALVITMAAIGVLVSVANAEEWPARTSGRDAVPASTTTRSSAPRPRRRAPDPSSGRRPSA